MPEPGTIPTLFTSEAEPGTNRPRPPRLICPPLRPAARASSGVHSCAVPFSCAARPPLLAISRCFSGDIDANPRRSLRAASTALLLQCPTTYGPSGPGETGGSSLGRAGGSFSGVSGVSSRSRSGGFSGSGVGPGSLTGHRIWFAAGSIPAAQLHSTRRVPARQKLAHSIRLRLLGLATGANPAAGRSEAERFDEIGRL
jgi:hypothetical protein